MKTVNFLEAINSGKRFRPVEAGENNNWWFFNEHGELRRYMISEKRDAPLELHRCDYDGYFELEEKSITITESEFDELKAKLGLSSSESLFIHEQYKKELGF